MTYKVVITDTARDELDQAYEWLVKETPLHAPEWHDGLADAILSLDTSPARCPLAPESRKAVEKIHQLLYGNKQHAYRILFSIRNDMVLVLHILHAAREP